MRRLLIAAILMGSVAASPTLAQTNVINLRVDKLEKEMKAVQRKVFPSGAALEPEIDPATVVTPIGTPSNAPIADLTERVNALENQLNALTGQVEQNGFRLKKVEENEKAFRAEVDARLKAVEAGASAVSAEAVGKPTAAAEPELRTTVASEKAKPAVVKLVPTDATVAVPKIDPARKSAVAAIEIPASGDDAEDSYVYGFRLYMAKFYPEAQLKLKEYIAKYPTGKRASFARNLLGRAYFDEGKPALASVAFYDNYQKLPRGERAAESLTWLGASLTRLKKTADACKVYAEFDEVYGGKASADLKAKVIKGRADAKCTT